jgi:hypothetical protein
MVLLEIVIGGPFLSLKEGDTDKEQSLWCEQRLILVMVKYILIETSSFTKLFENSHKVAALCANSIRIKIEVYWQKVRI